jgi:hypothetical protein
MNASRRVFVLNQSRATILVMACFVTKLEDTFEKNYW